MKAFEYALDTLRAVDVRGMNARAAMCLLCLAGGHCTVHAVAGRTGLRHAVVCWHLRALEKDGYAVSAGREPQAFKVTRGGMKLAAQLLPKGDRR